MHWNPNTEILLRIFICREFGVCVSSFSTKRFAKMPREFLEFVQAFVYEFEVDNDSVDSLILVEFRPANAREYIVEGVLIRQEVVDIQLDILCPEFALRE